ncbi:MAG: tandem-95 repeat protein [Bacteroidia bacterium]|nr:tandem-95 repeat protein [Bacteroidia bacterium]
MLQIENVLGNFVSLSAPNRSSNNFFNSRITLFNNEFLDRTPASTNTLGFDAGVFALENTGNTIIGNSQSDATLRLTSDQETYGLFLIGLAIDVWAPNLDPIVITLNQGSIPVDPGGALGFTFTIENNGNDNAEDLVITSTLPDHVANVIATNLPNGVQYDFDPNTGELVFEVEDGIIDVLDPALEINFEIEIKDDCYFLETNCDLSFDLQFVATYVGTLNGNEQTTLSSSGLDECNMGNQLPVIVEINQPTLDWITPPNALDSIVECGDDTRLNEAQALVPELDKCDFIPIKTSGDFVADGGCYGTGTYTNTWTYTDACGVTVDTYVQTITIEDTTPPTFTVPADITIECDENDKDLSITGDVTDESDNCSVNLDAEYSDQVIAGSCPNNFTITRTWTLVDDCGNSTSYDQIVTVEDSTPPTFNEALPADVTVNADAIPVAATLTASDNCGSADVVFNEIENGSYCDASHTIERTWVATDLCGLSVSHTQIITVLHPQLEVTIDNVVDVLCSSEATGSIAISVTGGIPPYTYSWNNGATSEDISNVLAGAYSVTVTDSNGCMASANATIHEPANPLGMNISKVDATTAQACANGEASVSVSGGTAPYTYQWSASAGSQTTAIATNLTSGTHTITVTDAHGCELAQSIVIECVNTCDTEITIDNVTNVLCTGDSTGSGTVSASSNANPSATFTFSWSNGQVDSGVTSSTLSNQNAGVYTVSVTIDGTVCQPVEDTISITEPSNVLNVSVSSTDELGPSTGDGTATAVATGGVEPYTYLWSPGGETTAAITGLSTGSYTVTVTDANGCTAMATVTVNPGTCNNLSVTGSSTPVVCFGESNGSVTATVSGGTGPFSYSWDSIPDTTSTVNNLPAGDYTVTVLDNTTECTQSITITINEPNDLSSGIAVTNIQCKNESTGSLDLTVNGGTPPYTYLWSEGSTTEDLINVPDGTYSVTITDANGCTTSNSGTVIEPDKVVSISFVSKENIVCTGTGTIVVEGSGGVPPYQYSIDGGATYQASEVFAGLEAGNYTVIVMDANGCTASIDGFILYNCTYAIDDINNTFVNVSVSGNVLTNDFDLEGDTQTVTTTTVTTAQGVTVTIDPNTGVYTYTPPVDYIGEDSFVYTVCDDGNPQACDSAVVYIEVISTGSPDNEAPIANPDTALTEIDTPLTGNVLSNDFDPDNDPITVTTTTVVTTEGVTVVIDPITGDYSYTPPVGYTGTDSFEYTICDDGNPALCDSAVVVITIIKDDGNITVANDDAYFTNPDTAVSGNVSDNDFDPEGDNQFVNTTPFDDVDNGTLVLNADGTFTYTPDPGFTGTDSFIYTVCDDGTPVACDKATVYLTVGGIGNTTDAIDDINNTYVNIPVDGNVLTNDQDFEGDTQTVVSTTVTTVQGVTVTIDGNTGAYTYTPPTDYIGEDSFEYTICDDGNPQACDTATVYIEVLSTGGPENEAPIANVDTAATEVDTPVNGNVLSNDFDPDGDPITVTTTTVVTTEGVTVEIDPITGEYTYTPPVGFTGVDTFEYTICDDENPALCDTALVIITVLDDVQNITIANDDAYNTTPDTLVSGNVLDNDSDPEGHNQFVNTTPFVDVNNGTLVLNADGTFDYTPDPGFEGTDSFVYTVCDDGTPVACDKATVYITVGGIKNTTDAIIDINNTLVNLPVSGNVLTNDLDLEGDTQTVTTTTVTTVQGVVVTIDANTGEYLYTPPTDYIGEDSFEYTICDDGNPQACDTATVYIEIIDDGNEANEAPIANPDTAHTEVDTPVSGNVLVNDFDPDGDPITVTTTTVVTTEGVTVEIDPITGEYIYNPPLGFTGEDSFEYTICDNGDPALCDTAIVVITVVKDLQNITIANDDAYFIKTCEAILGNVLDNDSDPEGHNQFVNTTPFVDVNNGSLVLNADGSFVYTPDAGFIGTDSFVYTVFDDGIPVAFDKATVYLTILDDTPPVVDDCDVVDTTIECDGDNNESIADQWNADNIAELEACATDACDSDFSGQVTSDYAFANLVTTCGQGGTITVTYTITDDSGNETTVVATLTLEDTTLPDLSSCTVADETLECDGANNESIATQWNNDNIAALEACASDACDTDLTGQVTSDFDFANLVATCGLGGTIEVTYTITDDCGNSIELIATLTLEDSTDPTFTVPADITIECDEDPNDLNLTGDVTNETDNCSNSLEATFNDTITPGTCANEFVITRTWTLTDDCGNTTTADQTITVVDTTAPVMDIEADDIVVECDGAGNNDAIQNWLEANGGAEATDNCGDVTWSNDYNGAESDCSAPVIVTFTATDACGNATSTSASYAIQDTTAPTIDTEAADATVECDGAGNTADLNDWLANNGGAVASDDCSSITWSNDFSALSDECGATGSATVTFTATDGCGNESSTTATFTIVDTTAPTFTVPADLTIECDQDPADLNLTGDVTDEADNCSTDLEATYTDSVADGACANESVITRTWTLTDDCGNTTTADQTITVVDTTAPTFTVPADITIECDQTETDLGLTGDVTDEADNCSTDLEATYTDSIVNGECTNEYIITRTWSLTDDCGNTTTADQTITVVDTTAPTFTVPADLTIECDQDPADLNLTGDVTDEADNCSIDLVATYSDDVAEGECANESIISRTWLLEDDCGNTTTLVQTITVVDTTAPTFTVPESITIECDQDLSDLSLTGDVTDEADNCSTELEATYVDSISDGACANEIIITRTWTLVDDCGNTTTADQTLSVVDTTAPVFSELPADATVECDNVPEAPVLTATDNCGQTTVTFEEEQVAGECDGDYILTRTWIATDECQNESVHIQIITVQDTTAPTVVGDFDEVINVVCDAIPEIPNLVFEDACSSNITVDFQESDTFDGSTDDYEIFWEWTVTDDCGNTAVYVTTVNVSVESDVTADSGVIICTTELLIINLFDYLNGDYTLNGSWTVVSGDIVLNGSEFDLDPAEVEVGSYTFNYTDSSTACPYSVDLTIEVADDCIVEACSDRENVVISKAVTANGDQWNEYFEITGIELCDFVVEVQIFNRWGAKIYESKNYQNDWNGFAHGNSVGSSGTVPTGTYYYIVNLRNSGLKPFAGPIYVGTK